MPRTERVYRVVAHYRNGEVKTRRYLTPEAADERRMRFEAGRPAQLSEAGMQMAATGFPAGSDVPTVTVTPSWPITYPRATGDDTMLEMPDSSISPTFLRELAGAAGIEPAAVVGIEWHDGDDLLIHYHADTARKHAPLIWRVAVENEGTN